MQQKNSTNNPKCNKKTAQIILNATKNSTNNPKCNKKQHKMFAVFSHSVAVDNYFHFFDYCHDHHYFK